MQINHTPASMAPGSSSKSSSKNVDERIRNLLLEAQKKQKETSPVLTKEAIFHNSQRFEPFISLSSATPKGKIFKPSEEIPNEQDPVFNRIHQLIGKDKSQFLWITGSPKDCEPSAIAFLAYSVTLATKNCEAPIITHYCKRSGSSNETVKKLAQSSSSSSYPTATPIPCRRNSRQ